MPPEIHARRLGPALAAGAVAIVANTLALKAADLVPLATAKGGLLRLATVWLGPIFTASGLAGAWRAAGAPGVGEQPFQIGFHLVVGLGMALVYAFALEPFLPGRAWVKGAIYALALWVLNAAVVLPATGEGFAGSAHLTLAGMIWFAASHTLFFVLLAVLFDLFRPGAERSAAGRRLRA